MPSCPRPRYKGGQGSCVSRREHPSLLTFRVDLCRLETAGTLTAHQQRCNKDLAHKHRAGGMCSHAPSLFHFPLSPQLGQTEKSWWVFFFLFQSVNVGFNHYLWMGTAIMFSAAANSSMAVTGPFCINGAIWLMTSASDIYVKCWMANKNYNFTSVHLMDFNLLPGVGTV